MLHNQRTFLKGPWTFIKRYNYSLNNHGYCHTVSKELLIEPESNFVKLIGTVRQDVERRKCGQLTVNVEQKCSDENGHDFSIFHRVICPKYCLKQSSNAHIREGDRINISGYLTTAAHQNYKTKPWFGISIECSDLKRCETEQDPFRDVCVVLLTAHIKSHIVLAQNIVTFILATNETNNPMILPQPGASGEQQDMLYPITVKDDKLQKYVRENLSQDDKVFIEGYLSYDKNQSNGGNSIKYGRVIATQLEKINNGMT